MKHFFKSLLYPAILLFANITIAQQSLENYQYNGTEALSGNAVRHDIQFNGYTNYWHDTYRQWFRYGNLFKMGVPNVEYTIAQSKADIAEDLGIPGLTMQEGFLTALLESPYNVLDAPTLEQINSQSSGKNLLILIDQGSALGKSLTAKLPATDDWPKVLKNHQANARDYQVVRAFFLQGPSNKIFVVTGHSPETRRNVLQLIEQTKNLLDTYDLKRGWFGATTLLKSVTCMFGHPLEVIGKGMNEGNAFFTFNGYMDFLAQDEIKTWLAKVGNPVVADVGTYDMFGCRDYNGIQLQDMGGQEGWTKYAKDKGGYIFRNVYDPDKDKFHYDGLIATEGNKEQIDKGIQPFVNYTGALEDDAANCLMLFVPKNQPFTNETMWKAIMDIHEVAILPMGKMTGPKAFRDPLNLLLLDRVYLEQLYGDRLDLNASMEDYDLVVNITNTLEKPVTGNIEIVLPPELKCNAAISQSVTLPAGSNKTIRIPLQPSAAAMNNANPVLVNFNWDKSKKSTMTVLDLPRAIAVHELLYGIAPTVSYPVTVHNFSNQTSFPVSVRVFQKNNPDKAVFEKTQNCTAATAKFQEMTFSLSLPEGAYIVKTSALGLEHSSQLGVGKSAGKAYLFEDDLNADGIREYRMENKSVRLTLIATGARVVEYYIKERDDNAFFKLWPEKPIDHDRSFRRRGFYPFGGFEDFLGQASMETHQVYDVEVIKKEGDYVQLRMSTDYFGNRLEKTYTLYGDSPLLEVRFALTFRNPEANVLGPQPILELGKTHGTEDVFTVPDLEGIKEFRMRPEEYFGHIFHLKEGWDAGYDSTEDIAFVSAFPVTEPLFLHMWMNHPSNPDSHYYYNEFQPWVPIYQKSTMYFSFYMWGQGGPWQDALQALRDRNLITERQSRN